MKDEKIQWYSKLKKKFTFAFLARHYHILGLKDPSPRLLNFWSEAFKAHNLAELWESCGNAREKNEFLIDLIFSNRLDLVQYARFNELFFDEYKTEEDGNLFTLEHYAAICGNSDIYLTVPKPYVSFIAYGIIDLAVMHEDAEFVRTVLDYISKTRKLIYGSSDYRNPHDAHPHFLNSPLTPLAYAANPEILNILHKKKYGFYIKNCERQIFLEDMAQNRVRHRYHNISEQKTYNFYQAPLENFQYLYLKYGHFVDTFFSKLDKVRILYLAVIASNNQVIHLEKFPHLYLKYGNYVDYLCKTLDRDGRILYRTVSNGPLIRWLIQGQGIEPDFSRWTMFPDDSKRAMLAQARKIIADDKLNVGESNLNLSIDITYQKLCSIRKEYYNFFLSNHTLIPMINFLNHSLMEYLTKDMIGLVAQYAIPIGHDGHVPDVEYVNNESKLRKKLLTIAEKKQERRTKNVVSLWKNTHSDLVNSSLISATLALPTVPQLHNMAKELKSLQHSVPYFWDLNSAKNYIKKILADNQDSLPQGLGSSSFWSYLYCATAGIPQEPTKRNNYSDINKILAGDKNSFLKELERIPTLDSLYHWVEALGRKIFESNNNFHSPAHKYIFDLKIANLARVCHRLKEIQSSSRHGVTLGYF